MTEFVISSAISPEDHLKKRKSEDLENNSAASVLPLRKRHASQWKQAETTSKSESNGPQIESNNSVTDQNVALNNNLQNGQTFISPKGETSPTNSNESSPLLGSEAQKHSNVVPKKSDAGDDEAALLLNFAQPTQESTKEKKKKVNKEVEEKEEEEDYEDEDLSEDEEEYSSEEEEESDVDSSDEEDAKSRKKAKASPKITNKKIKKNAKSEKERSTKSSKQQKPKRKRSKYDEEDEDEENERLYCVCRKPDNGKFMIACDECDEWFHVECIGLSRDKAESIQKYICNECRKEKDKSRPQQRTIISPFQSPSSPDAPKKCQFTGCTNAAKPKSKYCSDTCGIKAAKEILQQKTDKRQEELQKRIEELEAMNAVAIDPEDAKALQECEKQKSISLKDLETINQRRSELERAIDFAATLFAQVNGNRHNDASEETRDTSHGRVTGLDVMDCITCGQTIASKQFAIHVEHCAAKRGGTNGTTHTKNSSVKGDQLCGCPTSEYPSSYCERLRKACNKHVNWESVRKRNLEQEKTSQLQKLESVLEQEKTIKTRIVRRNTAQNSTNKTIAES